MSKRDRRHQLSQNSLKKHLNEFTEKVKPHGSLITTVLLGVLLILVVYVVWQRFSQANRAEFSRDVASAVLFQYQEPEQIDPLLIKYPKGNENAQIQILSAEALLRKTSPLMMTNRQEAVDHLEKAFKSFQLAEKEATTRVLLDRIHWGMAQSHEYLAALREGTDLAEAKKLYGGLAYGDLGIPGAFQKLAQAHLDALNRSWTPAFLTASINTKPVENFPPINFDPSMMPEPGTSILLDPTLGLEPEKEAPPEDMVLPQPETEEEK